MKVKIITGMILLVLLSYVGIIIKSDRFQENIKYYNEIMLSVQKKIKPTISIIFGNNVTNDIWIEEKEFIAKEEPYGPFMKDQYCIGKNTELGQFIQTLFTKDIQFYNEENTDYYIITFYEGWEVRKDRITDNVIIVAVDKLTILEKLKGKFKYPYEVKPAVGLTNEQLKMTRIIIKKNNTKYWHYEFIINCNGYEDTLIYEVKV